MILTLQERIATLSILPEKGDFVTLKTLNQLRLSLALTEDEIKEWGVSQDDDGLVSWTSSDEVEIPIGEVATGIIVDSLRKLEVNKDLSVDLLSIYEKFIPVN